MQLFQAYVGAAEPSQFTEVVLHHSFISHFSAHLFYFQSGRLSPAHLLNKSFHGQFLLYRLFHQYQKFEYSIGMEVP